MNVNNSSKSCSIKDIENICEDHKKNFTLNDARKLCKLKNEASSQFWKDKHMSKLSSIQEQPDQPVQPDQKVMPMSADTMSAEAMPIEQKEKSSQNWIEKMKENIP